MSSSLHHTFTKRYLQFFTVESSLLDLDSVSCNITLQSATAQSLEHSLAPPRCADCYRANVANFSLQMAWLSCSGSKKRGESGAPLHATTSALQIPSVQTVPRHIAPEQALLVPESLRVTDDSVFTASDWDNLLKGYASQYFEHDFWVDDSMIEGNSSGLRHLVWNLNPHLCQ